MRIHLLSINLYKFCIMLDSQVEASSYKEILMSLGLDDEKSVLFATDNLREAEAAEEAGWSVALTVRPGNAALPPNATEKFSLVKSMDELLAI